MSKIKKIVLTNCHFRLLFLKIGSIYYRASNEREYEFQSDHPNQGRFNKTCEPALYIGSSPEACIYEKLSQNETIEKVYIIKYELKRKLMVLDLSRWSYTENFSSNRLLWLELMKMVNGKCINRESLTRLNSAGNKKSDYSMEEILINQHITCPKLVSRTPWLYHSTNRVAQFARENQFDGLLYQSAVAHQLFDVEAAYKNKPNKLINYVIFQNSKESDNCFQVLSNEEREITDYERDRARDSLDYDTIIRKIKCKNPEETVGRVQLGNNEYEPSLPILDIEK